MGAKDWSPLRKTFIAIVGDTRDPFPIAFSGQGDQQQFRTAWGKAARLVREKYPDEWDYEHMIEEMESLGYKWVDVKYVVDL